jgi:hypothetical protein
MIGSASFKAGLMPFYTGSGSFMSGSLWFTLFLGWFVVCQPVLCWFGQYGSTIRLVPFFYFLFFYIFF